MVEPSQIEDWVQKEFDVISSAPVSFIVAVIGVGLIVWASVRYHYLGTIRAKDATLAAKDAWLDFLRHQLDKTGSRTRSS